MNMQTEQRFLTKLLPFLALLFATSYNASAQSTSMERYINKENVFMVAHFSAKKMEQKIDQDKYKPNDFAIRMILEAMTDPSEEEQIQKIEAALQNPEKIGLEIPNDLFIWMQVPPNGVGSYDVNAAFMSSYFNMALPIKDGNKFRTFLDAVYGKETTKSMIPTGDAMNLIDGQNLINWNKERLILCESMETASYYEEASEFQVRIQKELLEQAKIVSNVSPEASILKDENYIKQLQKDADFDFWVNYPNLINSLQSTGQPELDEWMQSFMGMFYDFQLAGDGQLENGEAKVTINTFNFDLMNKTLANSKLMMNKDFFKYLDGRNIMGLYSIGMELEGFMRAYSEEIMNVFRETKVGRTIADFMDVADIFIDEDAIYELMRGDAILAVTDIQVMERSSMDFEYNEETDTWDETESTYKEIMPIGSFMMTHSNADYIQTFIDLGVNTSVLSKKAEGLWLIGGSKEELGIEVYVLMKGNLLMITNDPALAKNSTGLSKEKQLSNEEIKQISSSAYYAFIDFENTLKGLETAYKKMEKELDLGDTGLEKSVKRLELSSGLPKNNILTTSLRLTLTDAKKNSLNLFLEAYEKFQELSKNNVYDPTIKAPIEEPKPVDGTKKL